MTKPRRHYDRTFQPTLLRDIGLIFLFNLVALRTRTLAPRQHCRSSGEKLRLWCQHIRQRSAVETDAMPNCKDLRS